MQWIMRTLAGLIIYFVAAGPAMSQGRIIRVTTTQAHRATIEQTEWAVGIIESRRSPQLAAEVAGEVIRVYVDEGQGVEAGQVLAEIDSEQYRLAKAADDSEVGRLSALLRQKEREFERGRELYKESLIAKDELEVLEGDLEALKEQLIGARAQVSDSERRLAETRLVAPVRAEISVRNIDVGDYLQTGTVAFDLIDIENLRVRLPFPEYRASQIHKGLQVRLRSAAAGAEIVETQISDVRPSINPANRSMTVIADFKNPGTWRPGASVRAEVVLEVRDDVIMVPQVSVIRRPAGDVVYILTGETAAEQPVQRGQRNDRFVEIKEGLSGGERVVVDGAGFLTDGSTVKIVGD
jgi:RND family efflux transporter MFP subunit